MAGKCRKQEGWLMRWDECHDPVTNGKNYSGTDHKGKNSFPKSKVAALGALYSLTTNPGSRVVINAAAPSSLRYQYSKHWTLASVAKAF